jgi:hypothetical protein
LAEAVPSATQHANTDARREHYDIIREHYISIRERLKSTGKKIKAWIVKFREEHKRDPRSGEKLEDIYVRELYILYRKLKDTKATLKEQLKAERPAVAQVEWQLRGVQDGDEAERMQSIPAEDGAGRSFERMRRDPDQLDQLQGDLQETIDTGATITRYSKG